MATILITGGNRGIGAALVKAYRAAGDDVIVAARSGGDVALDVTDDGSVASAAAALAGRPTDLLINNAGVIGPERQSSTAMDFAGFLATLDANTLGPLRVTQALLPNLRAAEGAKVAIISSQMGSLASAQSDHVAYRASKAAVNKASQTLATDLAREGIAVASLHPGWVRTDMGGAGADIDPSESAAGIKAVLDRLTVATTGKFWAWNGRELPW
jgi:NAD(P)-dependent dehydrogenase (short-subunit alcohol dehydrogenase family)